MNNNQLVKLLQQKIYYERERDKCLSNILFYLAFSAIILFKSNNYSGIKEINKIGWSKAGGWEKFNYIFDWIMVGIFIIYSIIFIISILKIHAYSRKLIHFNNQLLAKLNNMSEMEKK
ncbi:MAG: hypothetical protein I3274_06870 [Candidatus Moeniiplasma glomeromycotorum]|nr:hypothetical protein [Candidatus Moeniiplasma glomeromycotorum]MCE8168247.1 hypothetical protein [Candidatus Moeniiplasma glomeromycotorum]